MKQTEKRIPADDDNDMVSDLITGQARFVDDLPEPEGMLHGAVFFSEWVNGQIIGYDLNEAARTEGVEKILNWKDIPGKNQMGAVVEDEPCLSNGTLLFRGQAVFLLAAKTREISRQALRKIKVTASEQPGIVTLEDAIKADSFFGPEQTLRRGDAHMAILKSEFTAEGVLQTGGQEHWYLETQCALCIPGENQKISIYSSSQNPSETQAIVAEVLGLPLNCVEVIVPRLGGAFGGKETQANPVAAWAALLAWNTRRPVKIRLTRDEDQKYTGKRHPFLSFWKAGFDGNGKINSLKAELFSNGGYSTDLSRAILDRALFHIDNTYYIPHLAVSGRVCRTHLPSNTAFRGFGGPQGMAVIEHVMQEIARVTGLDPAHVRYINFYRNRQTTHFGQRLYRVPLRKIYRQLIRTSAYSERKKANEEFNRNNEFLKKGLGCMPVKFGISFTTSFLNQAGALVNIYRDGYVVIHHGGTEMGQGLYRKIKVIASRELGITPDRIKIEPAHTMIIPNTSATAASSGSDLNGMAVRDAIRKLKNKLLVTVSQMAGRESSRIEPEDWRFADNSIWSKSDAKCCFPFEKVVAKAYFDCKGLSETGYYHTPGLWFDKDTGKGKPFHYFAYGMAVSEVLTDTLTGDIKVLRTDILHDTGNSLHPAIDLGQIRGAFVQGMGWCTMEELRYDAAGRLLNFSPDTYKIPTFDDTPLIFHAELFPTGANPGTIHGSKAVGEPPFMLGLSVWLAIQDALQSIAPSIKIPFGLPATHEKIVIWAKALRDQSER